MVTPDHLRYFSSTDVIADRSENAVPGMGSASAQSTILIADDDLAIVEYAGGELEE